MMPPIPPSRIRFSEYVACETVDGEWRVEAHGSEGEIAVTIFSGPEAEDRAKEYMHWKFRSQFVIVGTRAWLKGDPDAPPEAS